MPKFMFYSCSPVLEQSKASSASPNPLHYLQAVQSCFLKIFPSPSFLSFPLSCVRPRCILAVCSNVYTFIFDTNKQTNEKCISMITSKLSRHLLHVSEALDFYSGGAQNQKNVNPGNVNQQEERMRHIFSHRSSVSEFHLALRLSRSELTIPFPKAVSVFGFSSFSFIVLRPASHV